MKRSVKSFVFDFLAMAILIAVCLGIGIGIIKVYEAWIVPLFPDGGVIFIIAPLFVLLVALGYAIYRAKNEKHF